MTDSTETVIAAGASKAVYGSSAVTVLLGLTVGEWAALIGIGATLATFAANLWFNMRRDQRERELHLHQLRQTTEHKLDDDSIVRF